MAHPRLWRTLSLSYERMVLTGSWGSYLSSNLRMEEDQSSSPIKSCSDEKTTNGGAMAISVSEIENFQVDQAWRGIEAVAIG